MKIIFTLVKQPFHLSSFRYQLKGVSDKKIKFLFKIFDKKIWKGDILWRKCFVSRNIEWGNIFSRKHFVRKSFVAGNIFFGRKCFFKKFVRGTFYGQHIVKCNVL